MATVFAPVHKLTAEEFRRGTAVTYLGQVHGTMAALRYMRPRNRLDCLRRVRSCLQVRAPAIGLLRRQVCHSWLSGCATVRIVP
jgi:NAD(P)-dependent dehydrogenase (short-subunit alcohol dehydrogenase family)